MSGYTSGTPVEAYASYDKTGLQKKFTYEPRVLGDREVEIAISHCGVCGSDWHTATGGWTNVGAPTQFPVITGHEIIGRVIKTGSLVTDLKEGDRVGVGAQTYSCQGREAKGACHECSTDQDPYCTSTIFTYNAKYDKKPGVTDGVAYGGYAKRVLCPADYAFLIPDEISSEHAAPMMCAGVTTFSPLKHFGAGPGVRVGVIGIGGLGHFGLQWAKALGAHVTAISHTTSKEKLCREKFGADDFIATKEPTFFQGKERTLDLIICTVNFKGFNPAPYMQLLKTGGKFVVVGIPEEMFSISPFSLCLQRISFAGSLIGGRKDIVDMLALAVEKNVRPLVEIMPMDKVNDALEHMETSKARFRVVLENTDFPNALK